ncbi:MAG: helix-turn-helix domain-containing protein [Devosia sp.]
MYTQSSLSRRLSPQAPSGLFAKELLGRECSLEKLFAEQPVESLDSGEAAVWQGDRAQHVFQVVTGAMRTVRILSDGRRVITGFLFAGDIVGISFRDRYPTTIEAIAPTRLRRLTRQRFEDEVARHPGLGPERFERLADEMSVTQDQVVLLARKNAEERVASFLLSLARRQPGGEEGTVELPMTRLDMADYLGLTIETVSRIMTRLTRNGMIAPAGRHAIVVRRPAALAALALEDDEDEIDDERLARAA